MRIAVVGTCASGKSTVVSELRRRGMDAYVVSQEHSIIRDLWQRQNPDILVLLEASFRSVQRRRSGSWPHWLYETQMARLQHARAHADVTIDTSLRTVDETVSLILAAIEEPGVTESDLSKSD